MLADVLDDRYVDAHGVCDIVGIALQTLHNKKTLGELPFEPIGQLRGIGRDPLVYRRSDVEAWAKARKA